MLAKAIGEFKKTNKVKGVDFTKKMNMLAKFEMLRNYKMYILMDLTTSCAN